MVVLVEKAVRKMQSKWSKKVKSKVRNGAKPIVDTMMVFMVNIGTNGFKESAFLTYILYYLIKLLQKSVHN